MRKKRLILNSISSLGMQVLTIICGIIMPQIMIRGFGSELYGATTSIADFLGYISLIEGGIGSVARSALYKSLAVNDTEQISETVTSVRKFFQKIAYVFVVYVLVIACSYKYIASDFNYDWFFTFALVMVISLSTFAEYFWGITNTILIQADQKLYIIKLTQGITLVVNTVFAYILIRLNCSIFIVKTTYCLIHFVRIAFLNTYVKKYYKLPKSKSTSVNLKGKWDGLVQHISYFIHTKTDIFVLTLFAGLSEVAVYSIYKFVVNGIVIIANAFIAGIEPVYGNMLAKKEMKELNNFFDHVEFLIHTVVCVLFSTGIIMIIPFVRIYTRDFNDAQYIRPLVAYFLLIAEGIYCMRIPYSYLVVAAGDFKETRNSAVIEAVVNLTLSVLLIHRFGMEGIVFATLIAMVYRTAYFVLYLNKNIICRPIDKFVKRWSTTIFCMTVNILVGYKLILLFEEATNYFIWVLNSALIFCMITFIVFIISILVYPVELKSFLKNFSIKK